MTAPVTLDVLRRALGAASSADGGATARLVNALDTIGWRGGDSAEASEVAPELLPAIAACARDHGDLALMYRQIADVLRMSGPQLDGGLPPVSAYLPAATEVVRHFATG